MTLSRILAATLVAGAVATPAMAGDAVLNSYAHTGSKGKSQVTLYGQVNVAAVIADDGIESEIGGVTTDNSQTRFGIKAKSKFGDGWKTGGRFEFEIEQIASDKFSQTNLTASPEKGDFFNLRRAEVFIGKGDWTLNFGQLKSATDGTLEVSVDPAKNVHSANIDGMLEDWFMGVNGEQTFMPLTEYDIATGNPTGGTVNLSGKLQIEDVIGKAEDGAGRNFGARIDFDGIDGVTLMASAGRDKGANTASDDLTYGLGAFVNTEVGGTTVKGGIGYTWNAGGNDMVDLFDVSASALLPIGLMLTAAYEVERIDGVSDDPTILHLMAGYQTKQLCDWGKSSISFGWSHTEDHLSPNSATVDYFSGLNSYNAMMAGNPIPAAFTAADADSEGDIFSLTATQAVKAAGLTLYASWLHYSAEAFGIDLEDTNAGVMGAKFKF